MKKKPDETFDKIEFWILFAINTATGQRLGEKRAVELAEMIAGLLIDDLNGKLYVNKKVKK